jgi:hypothetical protein
MGWPIKSSRFNGSISKMIKKKQTLYSKQLQINNLSEIYFLRLQLCIYLVDSFFVISLVNVLGQVIIINIFNYPIQMAFVPKWNKNKSREDLFSAHKTYRPFKCSCEAIHKCKITSNRNACRGSEGSLKHKEATNSSVMEVVQSS